MIYLLGTGLNHINDLSLKATEILKKAELIVGFKHSLDIPKALNCTGEIEELDIYASLKTEKIDELILRLKEKKDAVVVVGGSPLIFSYARKMALRLKKDEYEYVCAPSSIEYLSEKTGVELNKVAIVSGHNSADLIKTRSICLSLLKMGRRVGYYVKNETDIDTLFRMLLVDVKDLPLEIHAGFELGTEREKILEVNRYEDFIYEHGRWIVLIAPGDKNSLPIEFPENTGLDTEGIPVSREWSRSLVTHSLKIKPGEVVWDLGAGSGATSIWLASLTGCTGKVYGIEKHVGRYEKCRANTAPYPNIVVQLGDFNEMIHELPLPDAVHIGGGFEETTLERVFGLLPSGTRFACALATVDSVVILKRLKNIEYTCEMYTRSCARDLGGKTAFVGEHVFYLFKGEVK